MNETRNETEPGGGKRRQGPPYAGVSILAALLAAGPIIVSAGLRLSGAYAATVPRSVLTNLAGWGMLVGVCLAGTATLFVLVAFDGAVLKWDVPALLHVKLTVRERVRVLVRVMLVAAQAWAPATFLVLFRPQHMEDMLQRGLAGFACIVVVMTTVGWVLQPGGPFIPLAGFWGLDNRLDDAFGMYGARLNITAGDRLVAISFDGMKPVVHDPLPGNGTQDWADLRERHHGLLTEAVHRMPGMQPIVDELDEAAGIKEPEARS